MGFLEKMKMRFGVKSNLDVVLILIVFSIAGSSVVFVAKPILAFLGFENGSFGWWTGRILLIVPLYQVLLIVYGTLLGQFSFFWEKEKKMGRWLAKKLFSKA
ncbi:hypothetical protein IT568_00525 [bacterium]|nr:hypothetical protein [bacterium]